MSQSRGIQSVITDDVFQEQFFLLEKGAPFVADFELFQP